MTTNNNTQTKETIRLYASCLLSKWGFSDGDILGDLLFDNNLTHSLSEHKLLLTLIKKYLLPKLNHKVEVIFIETNHNPVRAYMIDGEDYSNWNEDDEWEEKLKPEYVEVTVEQILEEAKKIMEKTK